MKYFVVDDDDMIIPRNLHIREYDEYYTVHSDKINSRNNPFGQPPVDTPEYLTAVLSVVFVGTQVGSTINKGKNE
jgi:hypothetical protein